MNNTGYTLHLWNGKYGSGAKFIVEDNSNKKFAEFSPARPKDIAWVNTDLTKDVDYKEWESFEKEQVDNIDNIVM